MKGEHSMKTRFQKVLSTILALLMLAGCMTFVTVADGNQAKIGTTEYATLAEAITAAADGDTITLLSDVDVNANDNKINKKITIDGGEAKYKITNSKNGYMFHFYCDFTLKNLTFETTHGFRLRNTAGLEGVTGTLENVNWTLGSGLLVNIQGEVAGVKQTLNIVNSTITKKGENDPIIASYNAGNDVVVNIDNSTLNQLGGATDTHVGNHSLFFFYNKANVTLNVKNNSVCNYNPAGNATSVMSMLTVGKANVTANLEAGAKLNLLGSTKNVSERNSHFYITDGGTLAIVDNGAELNISKKVASDGLLTPVFTSYNGATTLVSWGVQDGDNLALASASPFKYTATADTVKLKLYTYTFKSEDFKMDAGASIRTEAPNAMAISGTISKELYDMVEDLSYNMTFELYLVKKSVLDLTKLGGTKYNLRLVGGPDKVEVNKIYWGTSEDGKTLTFKGCAYGLEADTEYVMVAGIDCFFDGEETYYDTEIVDADHIRSLKGIATEALKDAEYANNEYLKSLAGK